jgi:hypothetical protein
MRKLKCGRKEGKPRSNRDVALLKGTRDSLISDSRNFDCHIKDVYKVVAVMPVSARRRKLI